uniref:Nucleoprotein n=1 Tax=Emaravirus tritici TaxID=1980428 RepID=A0A650E872_9VIRU|nr:nucleoprotein [Emaravirus tritici]
MALSFKNSSGVIKAKTIKDGFVTSSDIETTVHDFSYEKPDLSSVDGFSLKSLLSSDGWHIVVSYQSVTNSERLNNNKKNNKTQRFKLFKFDIIVIPGLKPNKSKNVVSYNRFMALCIGMICYHKEWKVFNWSKKEYEENKNTIDFTEDDDFMNKLAMSAGFSKEHKYHWFYSTGFEYTFDIFPAEVIAMSLFRWSHRVELKIKYEHESDLVAPMVRQVTKRGNISDVMDIVGKDIIAKKYEEIVKDRSSIGIGTKYNDILDEFKDIFNKIDSSSLDSTIKNCFNKIDGE